ncbi:hypothetical protein CJF39_17010 [Pseudomonas lundensis]|uniref:Lipoprotein n=2 Tax=Pseudomonas lundensis TaxID=86185 RepID=A0A266N726_9PSED|nr:hypothetical protein CJF39_17010 [Pseudomonas lundensis]
MNMQGKHRFAILHCAFAAVALTGCAHNPQFSGQSVTDPVLRQDVMKNVELLFSAMTQCRSIDAVNTSITGIHQLPSGAVERASETWDVTGCGVSKAYTVEMRSDARGETDFSVLPQR